MTCVLVFFRDLSRQIEQASVLGTINSSPEDVHFVQGNKGVLKRIGKIFAKFKLGKRRLIYKSFGIL